MIDEANTPRACSTTPLTKPQQSGSLLCQDARLVLCCPGNTGNESMASAPLFWRSPDHGETLVIKPQINGTLILTLHVNLSLKWTETKWSWMKWEGRNEQANILALSVCVKLNSKLPRVNKGRIFHSSANEILISASTVPQGGHVCVETIGGRPLRKFKTWVSGCLLQHTICCRNCTSSKESACAGIYCKWFMGAKTIGHTSSRNRPTVS